MALRTASTLRSYAASASPTLPVRVTGDGVRAVKYRWRPSICDDTRPALSRRASSRAAVPADVPTRRAIPRR